MSTFFNVDGGSSAPVSASGAMAYRSAGNTQNVPGGAVTALILDTEAFDEGGFFDLANPSRLTAPEAGLYIVGYTLLLNTGGIETYFRVDGAGPLIGGTVDSMGQPQASQLLQLAAGQYVEAVMFFGNPFTVDPVAQVVNFWIGKL